ncbi:elongation of very long chain fatty acids protein F [Scaptodrosophila lebanonensis]|uniref:Elongation of very long chain fatty acids protein n=1 Tax=Drosophila lebanonensis TaxID=7225 RepID=A0A6J2T1W9_DROLE|nr:elongation of very long chain fatty acids protein F [Scaptodrosophila lebanonensis]
MAPNIIAYFYSLTRELFDRYSDPRVAHLPLVGNLGANLAVVGVYLAFVLHYGPKWMQNRRPFELKLVMQIYDVIQVVFNSILFVYGLYYSVFQSEYSILCQVADHSNTQPWMMRLLYSTYGYFLLKYLDLFDTVFIVLRKKNSQISFLHVYHHAGMAFASFIYITFLGGSHASMLGVLNLLVHTVMYSYYFASSIGALQQTLWWKRHITQLQLVQFGVLALHFTLVIFRNPCNHPMLIAFMGTIQNTFMLIMFSDFYYKTYIRKPRKQQELAGRPDVSESKSKLS